MKKLLLAVLLLLSITSYGDNAPTAQIVDAIKANPAMLDTPQAQKIMQDKGVSKSDVLQKVSQTNSASSKTPTQSTNATNATISTDNNATKMQNTTGSIPINSIDDENRSYQKSLNNFLKNPLSQEDTNDRYKRLLAQQIKERSPVSLERYGDSFFANKNGIDLSSLPVPDNYRLSANDNISITLYGPRSDAFTPVVDRDGNILLPLFGPLHVAGLTFVDAKRVISDALTHAYPNVGVVVSISKFSTIQITIAGEVSAPGVYNVTSFSTIKDALIIAGGISSRGSMRAVQVKRGNHVIKTIDLYSIIRSGDKRQEVLLQAGDVIVVPIAKKSVTLDGGIKHPAIYEPKEHETLADILKYAGGLSAQSSKYGIKIKRYSNHEKIDTLTISLAAANKTKLYDQDNIYVYDVAAANAKKVTLFGNVVKPGSRELSKDGMTLQALLAPEIQQQSMKGVFLEQTLFDYALIKHTDENLKESIISFSLKDALNGKAKVILHNRDEIYILNSTSVNPAPHVTISGDCVAKPGQYKYLNNMKVMDLINSAGIQCVVMDKSNVEIISYDPKTYEPIVHNVNIEKNPTYTLAPSDEVTIFDFYTTHPIQQAMVIGEVIAPGKYPVGENTSLKNIILAAGGLTQKADMKMEIVRFSIQNGKRISTITQVSTSDAMGENSPKVKPFDEIHIFSIPQWGEKKSIKLVGNVMHPGIYVIQEGEKLADVLKRAGGFTDNAFLNGAVFTRLDIKKIQEDAVKAQVQELEHKATIIAATPKSSSSGNSIGADTSNLLAMIASLKQQAKDINMSGRMTVHLDRDLSKLSTSPYNVTLKDGDALYVPQKEDSVTVVGEVMNPSAIIYTAKDPKFYIERSGGTKESADLSNAFVIHADGQADKISRGIFSENAKVGPGDSIVVPVELDSYPFMLFAKDISSILYQFAVTAAALKTVGAF